MKREDFHYAVSALLLGAILLAGLLGYLQSQYDLRKFVPHRYFAYATLGLTALHVYLNGGKMWRYFRRKFKIKHLFVNKISRRYPPRNDI